MEPTPYVSIAICFLITILNSCSAQEAYQIQALTLHNQYRQKHHSPPLQIDNTLNSLALRCAQYYAGRKRIDHSCPFKQGAGENLESGNGGNWNSVQFAALSTNSWYDEVKQYNYGNPGFFPQTGHFTQVVWKSSQRFGFAVFQLNGFTVGVGLYSPPGNYDGQFPQNVLQP